MQETLSHYFGYETFRPGQKEIITKILDHRNTLGVLPTGGRINMLSSTRTNA